MTVLAGNVLLRTHGFSPYQRVFGRDPELAFDVLVPGADLCGVSVRPSDATCPGGKTASVARVPSR